jgi:hypothetical protein
MVALSLTFAFAPSSANADQCRPHMPDRASDAQGYTFLGNVTAIAARTSDELGSFTFAVDRVFANANDPATNPNQLVLRAGTPLILPSASCEGIRGFRTGEQYLVSTSNLLEPAGPDSVAWLVTGEDLLLVRMYPLLGDERLADAHTLAEALALVAPDAAVPPTATFEPQVADAPVDERLPIVILVAAAAVSAMLRRRIRRRETNLT